MSTIQHIYTTYLFKNTDGVAGVPEDNDSNVTDFESHKESAESYDELQYSDIVLYHELSYADFHDKVELWTAVKYKETDNAYQLVLIQNEII